MPTDELDARDSLTVSYQEPMSAGPTDSLEIKGAFRAEYFDPDGCLTWSAEFPNTVVTVGKNAMLDNALAGSAYTVTGPFVGLISSVSFSGIAAADTMTSHAGWLEAGAANAPTYSGTRVTASWSAASGGAKALGTAASFTFTGNGTVEGAFMAYGSGAVSTIGNTSGTLFSAGIFVGGAQVVANGGNMQVSYSVSI